MKRLPRIDKRNADPGLLRQYQDMRNERRSGNLYAAVPIVLGICVLMVLLAILLQPGITVLMIISLVGIFAIFGAMFLQAGFSPRGSRVASFATVFAIILLIGAGAWFLDWLVGLLV